MRTRLKLQISTPSKGASPLPPLESAVLYMTNQRITIKADQIRDAAYATSPGSFLTLSVVQINYDIGPTFANNIIVLKKINIVTSFYSIHVCPDNW